MERLTASPADACAADANHLYSDQWIQLWLKSTNPRCFSHPIWISVFILQLHQFNMNIFRKCCASAKDESQISMVLSVQKSGCRWPRNSVCVLSYISQKLHENSYIAHWELMRSKSANKISKYGSMLNTHIWDSQTQFTQSQPNTSSGISKMSLHNYIHQEQSMNRWVTESQYKSTQFYDSIQNMIHWYMF